MDASKYYKESSQEAGRAEAHAHTEASTHAHSQEHTEAHHHSKLGLPEVLENKYVIIALAIIILIGAVYIRSGLLQYQGLFEPDGFFYYSIVRATLNSPQLIVPQHLGISGFPAHNFIGEVPGLPYLTVIFYSLLSWSGVSYLDVMRLLPVLFGLLEMVVAYFIMKELSNSRFLGILGMFFIGVSSGNVARTAALVYRGDSFISLPLMVALYLVIRGLRSEKMRNILVYALVAAFIISLGILIWNGSPYIVAVYLLSVALLVVFTFVKGESALARKVAVFAAVLIFTFLLQKAYIALGAARSGLLFEGVSFLVFYIPVLVAALFVYIITRYRLTGLFSTRVGRAAFAVLVVIVGIALISLLFQGYVRGLETVAGVSVSQAGTHAGNVSTAIGATTQELQKPTYPFLYASFGAQLYLAPIGVLLFVILGGLIADSDTVKNGLGSKNAIAFIILGTYLLVTAYLQYNAIRYNALVSIPIALFAAYGIYALAKLVTKIDARSRGSLTVLFGVIILLFVGITLYVTMGVIALGTIARVAIAAIAILLVGHTLFSLMKGRVHTRYLALAGIAIAMVGSFAYSHAQSFGSTQADGINPQFLSAMTWMKNNTPTNATVLALWPDGSVVEGWANRTSYMDSVGGENGIRIYEFARFLINDTPDTQYLYSVGKPEYFVSRQYWMVELQGLIAEGVPSNPNLYQYLLMSPTTTPRHNATTTMLFFSNGYYNVTVIGKTVPNASVTYNYTGYISGYQLPFSKITRVVFYNTSNYRYTEINASGAVLNYTAIVFFSGNAISGMILLTDDLYESNLFKTVFLCGQSVCPYNTNSSAAMQLIYINNDTRIFKINYAH